MSDVGQDVNARETQLRLALDASGVALWSWSPRTGMVEWDARMREIMGRDAPLTLPDYIAQAVHPEDRELVARNRAIPATPGAFEGSAHRIVRPDGSIRWVMSRGISVGGADGGIERIYGGTVDVTSQHHHEAQIRHAQRLDALGQLTAGVAHNFNNLLAVILNNLELLERRLPTDPMNLIGEARQGAVRAAELVRQLMTFAGHSSRVERRPTDVAAVVARAVGLCRQLFPAQMIITYSASPGVERVLCSEGEIEQIVMNLLLNARDAVLAGGGSSVTVTVDTATPPGQWTSARVAHVCVEDDGVGMTPEVLARAFDPFFTTKQAGTGNGLGLATSYAIARELGGQLEGASVAGQGATFDLWLPVTEVVLDAERAHRPAPGARGRVLVIDDEVAIRRAVVTLLADAGFEAEGLDTGERGIERLRAEPPIDVLLLDRSMPNAPGETIVATVRTIRPSTKIVLFSGSVVEPSLAARVDGVLLKPASGDELVAAVAAHVGGEP